MQGSTENKDEAFEKRETALERVADALIFAGFVLFSIVALAVLALASPILLAISTIAAFFKRGRKSGWRAASA